MSTDPAPAPDPIEIAFQARMAALLAPLQGQLQALVAQLNAAATAFATPLPIDPGPPQFLWPADEPIEAPPAKPATLPPEALLQEATALAPTAAATTPDPIPAASAPDPATFWPATWERIGDAGEGSAT